MTMAEATRGTLRLIALLRDLLSRIELWLDRSRQRGMLARLSDRELRDIGLNRYDAMQEWKKPFWRS